jgi:hypothetical protein
MNASLSVLRVAACIGQLRQVVGPDRADDCDSALVSMADGDLAPVISLLSRAALGTRDGPLREEILEAWALVDAVECEVSLARERRSLAILDGRAVT